MLKTIVFTMVSGPSIFGFELFGCVRKARFHFDTLVCGRRTKCKGQHVIKTIGFYNALWPKLNWDLNLSVCAEAQIPFRDIGLWLNNKC